MFASLSSQTSYFVSKIDDFFAKNAELVLSEALKLYQDDKDIIKLIHTIIYSDNRQFVKAFRNTAVSGIRLLSKLYNDVKWCYKNLI
ncbi:conjugative transfer protein [Orientia tsutsugamushi str. Boryong]|uniref:Conjugative transfer protein n=1 Tax=Orientia tsutsugamushi (strain Boryong) TaxID=357244 RepID=A5CFG5_ORITB|nr:conjugative transfer protein [Orientia tsutsugamushi str. Boryong]